MTDDIIERYNLCIYRPKVLFMGNGLIYNNSIPWNELFGLLKRQDRDEKIYVKDSQKFAIPYTQLASALFEIDDNVRHNNYYEKLVFEDKEKKNKRKCVVNDNLKKIVSLGFDAIITTNYTYEIEEAIKPGYYKINEQSKYKYSRQKTDKLIGADRRLLIHTCNQFPNHKSTIWHMHGELRRKSSIVLNHDEYGRLVKEILNYNYNNKNRYQESYNNMEFQSWVDYFILGDVYILGSSFDMSEFDMWWLLSRRLRENATIGKMWFYEETSDKNKYKHAALKDMGVEIKDMNMSYSEGFDYNSFYQKAIEDISTDIMRG